MRDGAAPTIRESVDGTRMNRWKSGIRLTNDSRGVADVLVGGSGVAWHCGLRSDSDQGPRARRGGQAPLKPWQGYPQPG